MSGNTTLSKMISSIKNTRVSKNFTLKIDNSIFTRNVLDVIIKLGYISGYKVSDDSRKLDVAVNKIFSEKAIENIGLISKSSRRFYANVDLIKKMKQKNEFVTYIISTSKGIMPSDDAIKNNLGGEVLFFIS